MQVTEVATPAENLTFDSPHFHFNSKHNVMALNLFINIFGVTFSSSFYSHWQLSLFSPAALCTPYVSYPVTFIPVFSLNTGTHLSLHCGNWHSTVEAIVNMAVLDCYKQTPVTPQAKLVCEASKGCCLLCLWSLCRFAAGPFLIAFSYTPADSFCIFNCQVKSFCRQSV